MAGLGNGIGRGNRQSQLPARAGGPKVLRGGSVNTRSAAGGAFAGPGDGARASQFGTRGMQAAVFNSSACTARDAGISMRKPARRSWSTGGSAGTTLQQSALRSPMSMRRRHFRDYRPECRGPVCAAALSPPGKYDGLIGEPLTANPRAPWNGWSPKCRRRVILSAQRRQARAHQGYYFRILAGQGGTRPKEKRS